MPETPDDQLNLVQAIRPAFLDFLDLFRNLPATSHLPRSAIFSIYERIQNIMSEFNHTYFVGIDNDHTFLTFTFPRYTGSPISGIDFWKELLYLLNELVRLPLNSADEETSKTRECRAKWRVSFFALMAAFQIHFLIIAIQDDTIYYFIRSQDGTISYSSRSLLESYFLPKDIEFLNTLFELKGPPDT